MQQNRRKEVCRGYQGMSEQDTHPRILGTSVHAVVRHRIVEGSRPESKGKFGELRSRHPVFPNEFREVRVATKRFSLKHSLQVLLKFLPPVLDSG